MHATKQEVIVESTVLFRVPVWDDTFDRQELEASGRQAVAFRLHRIKDLSDYHITFSEHVLHQKKVDVRVSIRLHYTEGAIPADPEAAALARLEEVFDRNMTLSAFTILELNVSE